MQIDFACTTCPYSGAISSDEPGVVERLPNDTSVPAIAYIIWCPQCKTPNQVGAWRLPPQPGFTTES